MFFPMGGSPPIYSYMGISFPRLHVAFLGVTTIRTTGSVVPCTFLQISTSNRFRVRIMGIKTHVTAHDTLL